MKRKQFNIPIVLILIIIVIIAIVIMIKPNSENENKDNKNETIVNEEEIVENLDFNARDDGFAEWENLEVVNEIPEYTGNGKLKQQVTEGNTTVVMYVGVTYEDAKAYYAKVLENGYINSEGDFSLSFGVARAVVEQENSQYKYRITYNETTRELSIKGTNINNEL